jgi:hypothetical protein
MAKPVWVHVPGPGGRDTTVQLSPAWQAAIRTRAGRGWSADYTPVAVKSAAAWLLARGYDSVRDGSFSEAVRRRAYALAVPR